MDTGGNFEHNTVNELHTSLDKLRNDFLPTMTPAALGNRAVMLQTSRQKLDGLIATTIAEAETAGVATLAGQRTMAQYVAHHTHCSPEDTRADNRLGSWARHFAHLEDSMLMGELSRRHLNQLRQADNIRVHAAMQRDQAMLAGFATDLEWKSFQKSVSYWLLVNDPDGAAPKDHETENSCTIRTLANGRRKIILNLDPVSGAIAEDAINAETSLLFDNDNEKGNVRTVSNRRAAAAANVLSRGAGRTETPAKPLINIVMSLKVLMHALEQLAKPPHEQDFTSVLDPTDVDGRCELIDGTPIHPKYALVLLMQARIRRQVLGAKSHTLNASVRTRLYPQWMKDIRLVETQGQCETAGCDAMVSWLQADHHTPYSDSQQTTLSELRMLCTADNKHKGAGPPLRQRPDLGLF